MALINNFPYDGVVTINRVILKKQFTIDDLQERVAEMCENVKTYHSDTGFIGGMVVLNSGQISNEGSTIGQALDSDLKNREALIITFWKRRSRAPSFSIYFLNSFKVVAPIICISPLARAGLNIFAASSEPEAPPAPTSV